MFYEVSQAAGDLTELSARRDRDLPRYLGAEQERLLATLRSTAPAPTTVAALRAAGVADPASRIYELQIAGHRIERVRVPGGIGRAGAIGFVLVAPPARPPAARRWPGRARLRG